jgi:Ion transport protein
VIFIVEACIKIVIYGFLFNGPHSYLRQTWNQLDFTIVFFSILAITPLSNDFKAFKVFRILRLISRNKGLKVAVKSLLLGLPNILNVTVIMLLFFLIFGVISVSQFKGRFYSCEENQDTFVDGESTEVAHKWDCVNAGGEWVNSIYNFDDIPNAIITLFVMSTTAGWQDILMKAITANDIDYVALEYRSPFWSFFYILFMIVGFFFFLNLFIGVVVTNFNTEKDKIGGNDLLTEKQREWIDLKLLVLRSAPIKKIMPPENKFRLLFFRIQKSTSFNNFIFVAIVLNTITLMLKWY